MQFEQDARAEQGQGQSRRARAWAHATRPPRQVTRTSAPYHHHRPCRVCRLRCSYESGERDVLLPCLGVVLCVLECREFSGGSRTMKRTWTPSPGMRPSARQLRVTASRWQTRMGGEVLCRVLRAPLYILSMPDAFKGQVFCV